jgi:hypothetical protein
VLHARNTFGDVPMLVFHASDLRSVSWRACHDGLDLGRSFVERAKFWDGSDSPAPALSNKRTRANVPSFSTREPNSGMVQYSSTWLVNDPAQTSSTGPSPNT